MVDQSQVDAVAGVKGIEDEHIAPSEVNADGVNSGEVDAGKALRVPTYADNVNALQEQESIWFNDGSGPDPGGYYAHDGGGVIGPLSQAGAFEDVDGDGVASLKPSHADFGAGDARNVGALDATTAETKVFQGEVNANHEDFATLQDALDFADTNGHNTIVLSGGSFGSVDPYSGQTIIHRGGRHMGVDGGTADHAIDFVPNNAHGVKLIGLAPKTTSGGGTGYNAINIDGQKNIVIRKCSLRESDNHGVEIGASSTSRYIKIVHCQFGNNCDGDNVNLAGSADRCVVSDCTGGAGASWTNTGTNNVITDIAN